MRHTRRVVTRAKRKFELAARTTISMPPKIMEMGQSNMRTKAFGSFSDYIEDLIRNDRVFPTMGHGMAMSGGAR